MRCCWNEIDRRVENGDMSRIEKTRYRRLLHEGRKLQEKCNQRNRWKRHTVLVPQALAMEVKTVHVSQPVVHFDTDSGPVGVDNRCSGCISSFIEDFEGPLQESGRTIKGFGGSRTHNVMVGTLIWRWKDDTGLEHRFRLQNSFYVKSVEPIRLLSPQHWAQNMKKSGLGTATCSTTAEIVTLAWNHENNRLTIPLDNKTNVATFYLAPGYTQYDSFCEAAEICIDEEDNHPLTDINVVVNSAILPNLQTLKVGRQSITEENDAIDWCQPMKTDFSLDGKITDVVSDEEDKTSEGETNTVKLLKLHQRFGHISFKRLQIMAKLGVIPKALHNCPIPVCSACLFGKKTRKPWRSKTSQSGNKDTTILQPGEVVSVDQLKSPTPGLIAQMTGRLTTRRYEYATVYVDQASRFGFIYLQKSATADETLEGKKLFEKYAQDQGITIKSYHADNGIFKANKWVANCQENRQGLTFAGVNAHHQNGIAEKRIRDLQDLARTSLIFAKRRWPDAISATLWPYALRQANRVLNETPSLKDATHRSPHQVFSGSVVDANPKHFFPFGCPVYVLDEALQTGNIHHKWKNRSRVGVYLGMSPHHNKNVALVLSLETGLVSPQFHVTFDPSFHTVAQERWTSMWQWKAGLAAQSDDKDVGIEIKKHPLPVSTQTERKKKKGGQEVYPPPHAEALQTQREPEPAPERNTNVRERDAPETTTTRYGRVVRPPKYLEVMSAITDSSSESIISEAMCAEVKALTNNDCDVEGEIYCLQALCPELKEQQLSQHPLEIFKAVADPDTMYLHQALKEPDRKEFIKAMVKEVEDQFQNGNFTIVPKSQLPKGATVLPAVWQMKRKRDIRTRRVKKYKARLNIDGSRMKRNVHYDPNRVYAPVASWNSIRTLLIMSVVHGWYTKQLDYVLAFPQAPVERDIYMKIPKGFEVDDGDDESVLRLNRNVYGQVQAGRVWNDYLKQKLVNELGFKQSKWDECVYFRGSVMYVLYTDDSILAGPDMQQLEQVVSDIRRAGLAITEEGDLQDFLGVNISRRPDGAIHLTQPHLIDQILKDLRLDDEKVKPKATPAASSKILGRHDDSDDFDGHFNYRSVIGKLNYLERGSRSDISYIVHQCARFTSRPKKEHGEALKWLGRYLKGTKNKGTVIHVQEEKDLEVYVDADFVGNWDPKEGSKRDTARSRHGYVIMYAGVPVTWKSQLQGEICLSSTESEYTGLSYALREAIPIMEMLKEMKKLGFPIKTSTSKVHCRVFEDNSGALEMAKIHKYRPRTKHLCVKLHHFRDYVVRKECSIHPIETTQQPADFLTKPLNQDLFEKHRKTVMGW